LNIKTVLITGARSFAALDIARIFNKANIRVIGCDCISTSLTKFSKAISKYYTTPSPQNDYESFIEAIKGIVKKENIDLIIPTCEEIFYLSKAKDKVCVPIFCESFDILKKLHNKWQFFQLIKEMGLKTPKTCLASQGCVEDKTWILKPVYSRFAANITIKKGPIKPYKDDPNNPWIIQEYIKGEKFCSYSICHKGQILAHGVYKVLHSMGIGSSICFQSVNHQKIDTLTEKFVKNMKFTGQIAFDFIENEDVYFIECNPRATSGIHLFNKNPKIASCFLSQDISLRAQSQEIFLDPLFMLWYGIKQKEIFSKKFWLHLFKGKSPLLHKGDNTLLLKLPILLLNLSKVTLFKNKSFNQAMTEGIEYNGE
jgi:predicted ATP-grasp superfamily ATP-dependent carboligase